MRTKVWFLMSMMGFGAFLGGCCTAEKEKLAQLTQDYETQAEQLRLCNDQLDANQGDLTACRDKLSEAMNRIGSLGVALEEARKKPTLPPGWQAKTGGMVMTSLPSQVLFAPGQAKLKGAATGDLKRIVSQINANFPGRDVYIIGHTDSDPIRKSNWRDNLDLSLQRSAAVARFLTKQGFSPKRVIAAGCGEHRPIASNATSKGKAANRRVEFWVLRPQ